MLIAIVMTMMNFVIPQIGSYALSIVYVLMPCLIVLIGMMMLLGTVGMKVSTDLGASLTKGVFGAIGFLGQKLIEGLAWMIKSIGKLLSNIYQESKKALMSCGMSTTISTMLSVIIVIIVLALII